MAGLYLHIPFCRQACHYCNFHFSTSLAQRDALLQALHQELIDRAPDWQHHTFETVYWGGGTPSLLTAEELKALWNTIQQHYRLAEALEITLEANPDDLTASYLKTLSHTPINRLSIGIQSFFEEDLQFMNRAHDAQQAQDCIPLAQAAGFEQLTVDLIYGSPTTTHERWATNLQTIFDLQVPHLSCYALTVEPRTALEHQVRTGKVPPVQDEHAAEQLEYLLAQLPQQGYEQYEISNFCRPPHYARHNSNYWTGVPYLGIGPSAHSFDGTHRRWNIAHNPRYIRALQEGHPYWEIETLTPQDRHNEYLMTALRTKWGVKPEQLTQWDAQAPARFLRQATPYLQRRLLQEQNGTYTLTDQGKLLADAIISDLFWVDA